MNEWMMDGELGGWIEELVDEWMMDDWKVYKLDVGMNRPVLVGGMANGG